MNWLGVSSCGTFQLDSVSDVWTEQVTKVTFTDEDDLDGRQPYSISGLRVTRLDGGGVNSLTRW